MILRFFEMCFVVVVKICHANVCILRGKNVKENYSTGIIKRNYCFDAVVCFPLYGSMPSRNNEHNENGPSQKRDKKMYTQKLCHQRR